MLAFAAPAMSAAPPDAAETFHVRAGRFRQSFLCGEGVVADSIERGTVLADVRRGSERWLLLSYWEPSNPANRGGNCGGGRESFLAWLHVRGKTLVELQSERYGSCRQNIEGGEPSWTGQHCSVSFRRTESDPASKEPVVVRTVVLFDRKAPEKGLQVTRQPAAKPG